MKRLQVHLAFHHHQPVGNLPSVLEDCYTQCYFPLLKAMNDAPGVRLNLSYSAPVLRFIENRHPEYFELLRKLIEEDRVELLATGFYEPVLADLPEEDRRGQLELSMLWYRERFNVIPRGAWLSEAVWDHSLVSTFRELGLEYTIIRSERFLQAGFSPASLHGYYITEYLGETLAVFPNDEELRGHMPFGKVDDLKSYLRRMANRSGVILTLADIAERWGAWPGTHQRIYKEGCIDQLIEVFNQSAEWLKFQCFSETLESQAPRGRCYLPGGVNIDLGAWSLPDEPRSRFYEARKDLELRHDASRFLPFFRSGCWESFRARYPEANLMNKKWLWLRKKMVAQEVEDKVAKDWLWQAQCNTAYWHGTSGGIYFPHLRQAVWERLLSAQRRLEIGGEKWELEESDVDGDGLEEVLFFSDSISIGFSPAQGGTLFEYSIISALHNFCNTLTRRHESAPSNQPHAEISSGHHDRLVDPYDRRSLHDHIITRKVDVESLSSNRYSDRGDFIGRPYQLVSSAVNNEVPEIVMEREGAVQQGGTSQALKIRKAIRAKDRGRLIQVKTDLANKGKNTLDGVYAIEFNLSLCPQQEKVQVKLDDKSSRQLKEGIYAEDVSSVSFSNEKESLGARFESDKKFLLWVFPLMTFQMLGEDSSGIVQGYTVIIGWPFDVKPGKGDEFAVRWNTPNVYHKKVD
ncbi:MAG: alpha-amylase/4-alpha-glucanotransferase domain-containing protein [Verrucomicrobiota bacterium]